MLTYFTKSKKSIKKLERGATDMETMTTKTTTTNVYPDQQNTLGVYTYINPDQQITLWIHLDGYIWMPVRISQPLIIITYEKHNMESGN